MTINRATLDFLEALNQDAAMQQDLDSVLDGTGDALQGVVEFATTKGFAVTAESLDAAKQALQASSQLSESELDSVAGGFNPQPEPPAKTTSGDIRSLSARFNSRLLRW